MSVTSRGPWRIGVVVSHKKRHLDERAAEIVARDFGHEHFSSLAMAKHEIFDPAVHDIERYSDEDWWLRKGCLFIGVGRAGWRFVDHPHRDHPDDCAFTLMLKFLGLYKDPVWRKMGEEVLQEDRNGASSQLHLATLIKASLDYMDLDEAEDAITGAIEFLLFGAFYRKQQAFQFALRELNDPGCCRMIEVENEHTGLKHRLFVVRSENAEAAPAARFKGATLVVHIRGYGQDVQQVYISSNKKEGVKNIGWLAAQLRYAEQKAMCQTAGHKWESIPFETAAADGMLQSWYYQKEAAAIFNRSKTAEHVSCTLLPLEQVVDIAKAFLHGTKSIRPSRK